MKPIISYAEFSRLDIRIGTIVEVNDFPKARKPAYKLVIDFGVLGLKKSSAQIKYLYAKEELKGQKVTAVVNFKSRQIANFLSEVLVLGIQKEDEVVLLSSSNQNVVNGEKIS
jgi:tRNA-binding protein